MARGHRCRRRELAWQADLGGVEPGTTVVADGIVYTGLGADRTAAHLRALDPNTGKLRWEKREHYQAPAVSNGVAYVTDNSGLVTALRETDGAELWLAHVPADSRAPAVVKAVVYVATIEPGHVYAMDAKTGRAVWDLPWRRTSPAASRSPTASSSLPATTATWT